MEPNEMFDNELENMALEEEKKAAERILARLVSRPEDRIDAGMMLDSEDFRDPVQLRVYLAIQECPASFNEYFAYDLEKSQHDRGDFNSANYVRELQYNNEYPYTRRDFLRQVMQLHDLAAPRRAYDEEMWFLEEMQEEGLFDDIELYPES